VIAAGEVHIWCVELDRLDDSGAELDAAERDRAARVFPGGHFFVNTSSGRFLRALEEDIAEVVR
jgi:surfactin synthase thioesterase subunit